MDRMWLEKYRLSNKICELLNLNSQKSQHFIELYTLNQWQVDDFLV